MNSTSAAATNTHAVSPEFISDTKRTSEDDRARAPAAPIREREEERQYAESCGGPRRRMELIATGAPSRPREMRCVAHTCAANATAAIASTPSR
jgi:hypothetical protein